MITVECTCGQILRASPSFAGAKVTCPKCRKPVALQLPGAQSTIVDGSSTTKTGEPAAPPPKQFDPQPVIALGCILLALVAAAALVGVHFAPVNWRAEAAAVGTATPALRFTEPTEPGVEAPEPMPDPSPEPAAPVVLTSFSKPATSTDTPHWHDARLPVQVGQAELRIERVKIGRVAVTRVIPTLSGLKSRPMTTTGTLREEGLAVHVSIRNLGSSPIQHQPWDASQVRLSDDRSQSVELIKLESGVRPLGQKSQTLIGPGQELRDVLVFQVPAGQPDTLRLELDAQHLRSEESARLAIPREMIGR